MSSIAAGIALYSPDVKFPGYFALLPTLGTAALILAGTRSGSWASLPLGWRPCVDIGRISYSLYLVHWPLKVFIDSFVSDNSLWVRWGSLALSIGLAAVLFHVVEDPIRRGARLPGSRRFLVGYAVGFVGVLLVLGSAVATRGWRFRFGPEVVAMADHAKDQDNLRGRCEYESGAVLSEAPACHLGRRDAPAEWLILGDSHAWALGEAFSLALRGRGEAGTLAFRHRCLPVLGMGSQACQAFTREAFEELRGNRSVHNVVLVSIWRQVTGGPLAGPDGSLVDAGEVDGLFQRQFALTLRQLSEAGKQAYVWGSLPAAQGSVPLSQARALAFSFDAESGPSRAEHEATFAFLSRAVEANQALIERSIWPADEICESGECRMTWNGAPLFFDNNHPSLTAAPFFAQIIEERLREAPVR